MTPEERQHRKNLAELREQLDEGLRWVERETVSIWKDTALLALDERQAARIFTPEERCGFAWRSYVRGIGKLSDGRLLCERIQRVVAGLPHATRGDRRLRDEGVAWWKNARGQLGEASLAMNRVFALVRFTAPTPAPGDDCFHATRCSTWETCLARRTAEDGDQRPEACRRCGCSYGRHQNECGALPPDLVEVAAGAPASGAKP